MLPKELQITIFTELNINELKYLYNTDKSIQSILNSKEMLNQLNDQYDVKATSFQHFLSLYNQKSLDLLNRLGKIYHAKWEFDWDNEAYGNYQSAIEALKNNVTVFLEDGDVISTIDEVELGKWYGSYPNEHPDHLKELSKMILSYKKIVLIGHTEWRFPKEWYKHLVPSYIKINIPFKKITISSELKGTALTIADVLLASRFLTGDKYEIVIHKYYKVLEDNDILVLELY